MEHLRKEVKRIADLLEESSHAVVFTGEGISVDRGLPDFHSLSDRLPTMVAPDDFSIRRFDADPQSIYEAGAPYFDILERIEPNEVHTILAVLEKRNLVKAVVTQNIDGLHRKAGSKNVLEIHGTLRTVSCVHCDLQLETEEVLAAEGEKPLLSFCPDCGEPLKPDVVLSGEPPPADFHKALEEIKLADLVMIIGSDMKSSPADQLPVADKDLVIINKTPTDYDHKAKIITNENPIQVMIMLLAELDQRG